MEGDLQLVVKENPEDLAQEAARIFAAAAVDCAFKKGRFAVVLSGGSTPGLMHNLLAEKPFISEIPWEKTHIFWADERCVPENHPHSNFRAAKEDLVDKVPIPESHVYPMSTEFTPEKGADAYQQTLSDFFKLEPGEFPRFDLIFLGMGSDGHTASLFPDQSALEEKERFVVSVKGGNPDVYRLTMTLPVLNNARYVVFLISGKQKAEALKTVLENSQVRLPAKRVRPVSGKQIWLIDREASSLLSKSVTYGKT
ncbi:MAG: 6-phosphogluconolactonase [Deltaproteobacteria bacterium]|nr:6-phosphogluconolactonase [Deltaproteobacteria bacterium]